MNVLQRLRTWWPAGRRIGLALGDSHTPAWVASILLHAIILASLTLIVITAPAHEPQLTLLSDALLPDDPLTTTEDFNYAEASTSTEAATVGTYSGEGGAEASIAAAPALALGPASSVLAIDEQAPLAERLPLQEEIRLATGPKFVENLTVKGAAGVGAVGAVGAIDRITQEILLSLEERRTLVVWLFDQSGSLARQRGEINKRFDRIYDELGVIEASGNPAFKRHDDKPLLSAVLAFGENVTFLTPKPTDQIAEIKAAVAGIKTDESGIERTFHAVSQTIERYRQFRTQEPRRNVMIVLFTDESGDDENELDRTVALSRRFEMPVYCIGVPAPFGRRDASIKYVDPDPKYDQTPQWINVRQGPESMLPELVKIGDARDEAMDSGFGPYSLTRLCYETGGIFFAVHPNRQEGRGVSHAETAVLSAQLSHFFDPDVMRNYRPDYVTAKEYQKLLNENKARAALVQAAEMSWVTPMEQPTLRFPKRNDADLANQLTRAQQAAAVLEPKIQQLYEMLRRGERDRARLTIPRWQAGYDLSYGRVLALKVRTEGYNAMLAKAKQGLRFTDPKNDTWQLQPDNEVSVGSVLEKQAAQAKASLERVVQEHPGTPWALLAAKELQQPLGWKWQEIHTGVNDPPQVAANRPPQRRDDKAKMLPKPERRPAPKL